MKYHIGKDGRVRPCRAKGICPLGGEHFESEEEGQAYLEREGGGLFSEAGLSSEERLAIEDRIIVLNELEKESRGLSRVKIRGERATLLAKLEGRDLEREAADRKARLEEEELISEENAKVMAERDTLEIPDHILSRYIYRKPFSRVKVRAYRGERASKEGVNSGMALYGLGRYTTTSKAYAERYGTVRKARLDELPSNPLRFRSVNDFEIFEGEMVAAYGTTKRNLYRHMDVSDLVKKTGHDGVTIGTGSDMIIVSYNPS